MHELTTTIRDDVASLMQALGHRDLSIRVDPEHPDWATTCCGRCSATVYARVSPDPRDRSPHVSPLFAGRPVPTCDEVLANDREMQDIIAADTRRRSAGRYGEGAA